MNNLLKNKFPFAYNYFETLIDLVKQNKRTFPQALIFEGEDTVGQYLFALELARIMNCENNGEESCSCVNCKWIREFSHPAVNNVSEIHFKGDDDTSTTVISAKQANQIERSLALSSDYHRFFIFFSSKNATLPTETLEEFEKMGYSSNIDYSINPLIPKTFSPTTLNALLKSVEEPPEKTTFIFLTKTKENILQTIASRCLVFKLSGNKKEINYDIIKNLFNSYPKFDYKSAMDVHFELLNIIKNNEIELVELLNMIMEYLKDLMKNNITNEALVAKIIKDIKLINEAIKMSKASILDSNVLEVLMLEFAEG